MLTTGRASKVLTPISPQSSIQGGPSSAGRSSRASLASSRSAGTHTNTYVSHQSSTGSRTSVLQDHKTRSRRIDINKGGNSKFVSNHVSTTKYEFWNIVPKNLFEQFRRVANFWFLTVSVFQMLPLQLSPTNKYATLFPLCCVLFVTFCKDFVEDWRRRRDDHRVNNQVCTLVDCIDEPHLRDVRWKDVTVGSCLRLIRDSPIPADMVLLSCSNEDGIAYVDTAQLDGETTLKPKFAVEQTMHIDDCHGIAALEGRVESELPNEWVQSFTGVLHVKGRPRALPLDVRGFLLRGSTLRNTAWAFGLTIFTGVDTKLVRNSKKTPSKRSRVEVTANHLLFIVFAILCIAALASAISRAVYSRGPGAARLRWVWPESDDMRDSSYLSFITFMIGFNNFIPISLYVTMDMVRTFQAAFMERDRSMYHEKSASYCKVKNSNLCENLGQIEFVFSDKTGTLTENEMQFKAVAIEGRSYGQWDDHLGPVNHVVSPLPAHICQPLVKSDCPQNMSSPQESQRTDDNFSDLSPRHAVPPKDLESFDQWMRPNTSNSATSPFAGAPEPAEETGSQGAGEWSEEEKTIDQFFKCLALCHTAIPEQVDLEQTTQENEGALPTGTFKEYGVRYSTASPGNEGLREEAQRTVFKSPSPDEEALLSAARDNGYFFRRKAASEVIINVRGVDECYQMSVCNSFTSERKRMSVLVRDAGKEPTDPHLRGDEGIGSSMVGSPSISAEGSYTLYAKGADNVMFERLSAESRERTQLLNVHQHLEGFASCGLRTLVLAKREVPRQKAEEFLQRMGEAKNALMNRNELMEVVAGAMEQDLEFLGITAIEDKIQRGVPETVDMLLRAGIKVWVLTGDKMETAINFGVACKLISRDMKQYVLDTGEGERVDVDEVTRQLQSYYNDILHRKRAERSRGDFQYCVVAHGEVLYTVMDENQPMLRRLFIGMACSSHSVLACRLAPAQKGALVNLVRNGIVGSPLTLSIGDGANDVSMIQEAHVGVGILGVEGRQAANSADFAIGQFRFLQQLLFIHGRWNLRRVGIVIGYSFYKNFLLVLPMVYFTYQSGFSGTTLYDSYLLTVYNLVFTSLPILVMGVFDSDVAPWLSLAVPGLYQAGVDGRYFNPCMFIGWIARGGFHSMVTFAFMLRLFGDGQANLSGQTPDLLVMGSWVYWTCVVIVNVKLLFHMKAWMDWEVFLVVSSALVFLPWLALYSTSSAAGMFNMDMVGVGPYLFGSPTCWLGLILVVAVAVLTDLAVRFARKTLAPDPVDILLELQLGHFPRSLLTRADIMSQDRPLNHGCLGTVNEFDGIQAMEDVEPCEPSSVPDQDKLIQAEVEQSVQKIPSPPPKLYKIREVAGCNLQPLELGSPALGHQRCLKRCCRIHRKGRRLNRRQIADVHVHTAGMKEIGLSSIGPMVTEGDPDFFMTNIKSEEKRWWKPRCVREICNTLLEIRYELERLQWCEMTVAGDSAEKSTEMMKNMNAVLRNSRKPKQMPAGGFSGQGSLASPAAQTATASSTYHSEQSCSSALRRKTGNKLWSKTAFALEEDEVLTKWSSERSTDFLVNLDCMYSAFTLNFLSRSQESKFRAYLSEQSRSLSRKTFPVFFVAVASLKIFDLLLHQKPVRSEELFFSISTFAALLIIILFQRTLLFTRHAQVFIQLFCVVAILVKHMLDIVSDDTGILTTSFIPICVVGGTSISFVPTVGILFLHLVCFVVRYAVFFKDVPESGGVKGALTGAEILLEQFVLQLGIACLSLHRAYTLEMCTREEFVMQDNFKESQKEVFNVLCSMFPDAIAGELVCRFKRDGRNSKEVSPKDFQKSSTGNLSEVTGCSQVTSFAKLQTEVQSICNDRGIVSIIFCDIYDFESLLEALSPTELVRLLDSLWNRFDAMCDRHNIVKIETVGKTYMACAMSASVSDTKSIKHVTDATRAVLVGIDMLELAKRRVLGLGSITKVAIKIGIHSGRTSSGVVGSKKPQYALFGDTVNTAARMQSTGQRNHLHISSATFRLVRDDTRFSWEARMTPAKGKGIMDTYLLTSYRNLSFPREKPGIISHTQTGESSMGARSLGFGSDGNPGFGQTRTRDSQYTVQSSKYMKGAVASDSSGMSDQQYFSHSRTKESSSTVTGGKRSANVAELHNICRNLMGTESQVASGQGSASQSALADLNSKEMSCMVASTVSVNSRRSVSTRSDYSEDVALPPMDTAMLEHIAGKLGYFLSFSSTNIETEYRAIRKKDVRSLWKSFLFFLSCYIVISFVMIFDLAYDDYEVRTFRWLIALRLGYIVLTLPLVRLLCKDGGHRSGAIVYVVFAGFLLSLLSIALFASTSFRFSYVVEVYFFITTLSHNCGLLFVRCIVWLPFCATVTVIVAALKWGGEPHREWFVEVIVSLVVLQGLQIVALYFAERRHRLTFVLILAVREEHEGLNHLLNSMLPPEVLLELKAGSVRDAYLYTEMTMLFSDIVEFTKYCANHTVEESVSLVTQLFSEIDKFTVMLGVYKVCTIGDAYVVVNQPRARSPSKYGDCVRVVIMAMWMLTAIKKVRQEVGHETLDMRIGIHCGSFVGGVIGTKRLRFDVWGPDVLTANLVEQEGLAGSVVVSQQAKSMLQHWRSNFFQFLPHKTVTLRQGGFLDLHVCQRHQGGGGIDEDMLVDTNFDPQLAYADILSNLSSATD